MPHVMEAKQVHRSATGGLAKDEPFRAIIKSVRMRNFMPYDDTTFEAGEKLNMILGPNGSGKSTIISAISVGLGFNKKNVDRTDSMKDFIKFGRKEAMVDITLKQPGGTETVIQRKLHEDGKSTWMQDDRAKTEKHIKQFVSNQGIKLDNLCHFLPQEKVAEFATTAGNEVEMLNLFQKAVGPPAMIADHGELIKIQQNTSDRTNEFEAWKKQLADKELLRTKLEDEMSRYEKLQELEEEIEVRQKKLFCVKERNAHQEHAAAEGEERNHLPVVENAEQEYEKVRERSDKKERELKEVKAKMKKKELEERQARKSTEEFCNRVHMLEGEKAGLESELNSIDARRETWQRELKVEEQKLQKKKDQLKETPKVPADIDPQITKANKEVLKLQDENRQISQKKDKAISEVKVYERMVMNLDHQLEQQTDAETRRLQHFKRQNGDGQQLYRIREWFNQNQDKFKQKVYGPIGVELEVEDKQIAIYLEAHIRGDMKRIIFQNRDDLQTFNTLRQQPQHRSLLYQLSTWTTEGKTLANGHRKQRNWDLLRSVGIESTLLDRVKAPEPVMYILSERLFLKNALVGSSETMRRMDDIGDDPRFCKEDPNTRKKSHELQGGVYTPGGKFSVNYSMYGQQRANKTSNGFSPQNLLPVGGVDESQKEKLEQERRNAADKLEDERRKVEQLATQEKDSRRKCNEAQTTLKDLKDLKGGAKKMEAAVHDLERLLVQKRQTDPGKERGRKETDMQTCVQKMVKLCSDIEQSVKSAAILQIGVAVLSLKQEPMAREIHGLRDELKRADNDKKNAQNQHERLVQEEERTRGLYELAKQYRKEHVGSVKSLSPELRAKLHSASSDEAELETEIANLSKELDELGMPDNKREDFERVKEDIILLNQQINERESEMRDQDETIERIKQRWLKGDPEKVLYPRGGLEDLIKLVAKEFSDCFAEMGNAGDVELVAKKTPNDKDDFAGYGLRILVRFRTSQQLSQLDKAPSGGEKSLTIMMFIVSLQQLTHCPVRVVDEINQGLDVAYEKAVFDKIVKWSCRENTSQCFLITPKLQGQLLSEVRENITVHYIIEGRSVAPGARKRKFSLVDAL